ncbi:hypothetical protein [Companilactobacillus mishanensis]|uniref:DUF4352 domain-containing protein n=1 Tax=Companilactobacillus mishanensis TaxID=2486008 RepID=A0A5P0ZI10_9LACO|nr:hypothetical protein [Companilactobacillus mishanensis]MQS52638.1 hypothetical protein [Companilactobacillus mishanensis]
MKKMGLIFTLLGLFIIVGCSNSSSEQLNNKVDSKSVESVFYQDLSKQDKKNVKFTFRENEDQTADEIADPVYVVSMTVKNNSNKTVKFNQSKFILIASGSTKFTSSKNGTLILKSGEQKSVDQLFENVGEQALVGGDNIFAYLNDSNKIGTAKFTIKRSKNTSSKGVSSDNSTDQSNGSSSTASSSKSNHIITSPDMALSLYTHAMAVDPEALADSEVQEVSNGYQITDPYGSQLVISYSGDEIDSDGEVTPFSQLVGSTHRSSGWVYNGQNYNQ